MPKHTKHRAKSAKGSLVLVVTARDGAAYVEHCLVSTKLHVDRMIVLDTGSTNDTVTIAEAYGAQVHHFTWVDDLPAARNAVLVAADADRNLVLDADEWIEAGTEELHNACTFGPLLGAVCICLSYAPPSP